MTNANIFHFGGGIRSQLGILVNAEILRIPYTIRASSRWPFADTYVESR